ncbi:hypothetical protein RF11_11526 [Thelohanellus kitauei]|uniref:F-box domain-containing protein n=1 Tax=Thelohanellus kitauei TaxID=669202 RepID=A0A0C2N503_THEKT|nr:hypothetical protein RF11_11526 [Thelohanellus kitauei]
MYIRPLTIETDNIHEPSKLFPKCVMKNVIEFISKILKYLNIWQILDLRFLNQYFNKTLNLSNNARIDPEFIEAISSYCPRIKCLILENSDISFINELDFYILNRLNLEKVIMPWTKANYLVFMKHIDIRGHKLSPDLLAFIIKVFYRLQFLDISECVFDFRVLFNLLKETSKRKYPLTIKISQLLNVKPALLDKNIKFITT